MLYFYFFLKHNTQLFDFNYQFMFSFQAMGEKLGPMMEMIMQQSCFHVLTQCVSTASIFYPSLTMSQLVPSANRDSPFLSEEGRTCLHHLSLTSCWRCLENNEEMSSKDVTITHHRSKHIKYFVYKL